MKKKYRITTALDVTKLFETRTFHVHGDVFVDVVHDTDEKCFMYWIWKDNCGHKMFTVGLPEHQPVTGEDFGWDEATAEDELLYIYEEYVDMLEEEIEDLETMAEARFNAKKLQEEK